LSLATPLFTGIETSQQNLEMQGVLCSLCGTQKRCFEPTVLHCQGQCGQIIKKKAAYYTDRTKQNNWCDSCYPLLKPDLAVVLDDGSEIQKKELQEFKNDALPEEAWVHCDQCHSWVHQVCALFNGRTNKSTSTYTCPNCHLKRVNPCDTRTATEKLLKGAEDLTHSKMSTAIENGLKEALRTEYTARAEELGVGFDEVEKASGLTVRVVSNLEKKHFVRKEMLERYSGRDSPTGFPVRSKCIALFQKIHGVDALLFSMYVYEYGHDCPAANRRRVYLSYLDSVQYFEPKCYRTVAYQAILVEYLRYVKERGFHTAHIWSCPPTPGDDYIFYYHPTHQLIPHEDMLRAWYHQMLDKAKTQGVVIRTTTLYDEYFTSDGGSAAQVSRGDPTCLPYFEGDYIPGEIENIIKLLKQHPEASSASQDDVMRRLGHNLSKMKDNFIVVHLRNRRFAAAVERGEDVSDWLEDSDDELVRSKRAKISGKGSRPLPTAEEAGKTKEEAFLVSGVNVKKALDTVATKSRSPAGTATDKMKTDAPTTPALSVLAYSSAKTTDGSNESAVDTPSQSVLEIKTENPQSESAPIAIKPVHEEVSPAVDVTHTLKSQSKATDVTGEEASTSNPSTDSSSEPAPTPSTDDAGQLTSKESTEADKSSSKPGTEPPPQVAIDEVETIESGPLPASEGKEASDVKSLVRGNETAQLASESAAAGPASDSEPLRVSTDDEATKPESQKMPETDDSTEYKAEVAADATLTTAKEPFAEFADTSVDTGMSATSEPKTASAGSKHEEQKAPMLDSTAGLKPKEEESADVADPGSLSEEVAKGDEGKVVTLNPQKSTEIAVETTAENSTAAAEAGDADASVPEDKAVATEEFPSPEAVVATNSSSEIVEATVAKDGSSTEDSNAPMDEKIKEDEPMETESTEPVELGKVEATESAPTVGIKRGSDEIADVLSRHVAGMNRVAKHPVASTVDEDEPIESELFESRQQFLNYCQTNHCQFDELRRAKHSSMMVLFQLHNPMAPMFLQQCGACYRDITHGVRYHCNSCSNFDLCQDCYKPVTTGLWAQRDARFAHDASHTFAPFDMEATEQTDDTREGRQRSLKAHLELIEHVASCGGPPDCPLHNCQRMKKLFEHVESCEIKPKKECKVCSRLFSLCCVHARTCTAATCKIPFCDRIRQRNKRLRHQQQLMDDRRRRAQNELYHAGGSEQA